MTAAEYNAREMAVGRLTARHLAYLAGDLEAAVRRFQAARGLVEDGRVGPLTRAAIERAMSGLITMWPVEPWYGRDADVSSPFGDPRPDGPHRGADLMFLLREDEPAPSEVYTAHGRRWCYPTWARAAAAGRVLAISRLANGVWIKIRHRDGARTQYGHLGDPEVRVGQEIDVGTKLGGPAPRGRMWPQHLHFGLQQDGSPVYVDPIVWLRAGGARV